MPNWQPNWNNVRWDWGAAGAAAAALRRAADKIDQTAHERARVAAEAQQEWRGRYRLEFDERLREILQRAGSLAAEYRHMASRIDGASNQAYHEQRHREAERRRWWREKRAEEERARRRKGN
jgi:uncharacterized protein YukE